MQQLDVIVIGAGPAGMFAAARAAQRGRSVLLLEKNRKPGVKILMSGGTRCNLTHAADRRGIAEAFGRAGERFLHAPLAALGPDELIEMFHARGVPTKVEPTGKVFPTSDRALDVARACVAMVQDAGAEVALGEAVEEICPADDGFQIATSSRELRAARVVLACGGRSYPGCGTTGDGYAWAKSLGHKIVPPRPALAPLTSESDWVKSLQGVAVPDATVAMSEGGAKPSAIRRGSLLFTHFGLSGPAAMDVSGAITERPSADWSAVIDFVPDLPEQQLRETLRAGARTALATLAGMLPKSLAEQLLELSGVAPDARMAELSKAKIGRLADALKRARAPITGTLGFKKAEVTAGGVALPEVSSKDMQSRVCPGLFLAGEVLDLDGPIGGYNFQAAFSTGWLAGTCV